MVVLLNTKQNPKFSRIICVIISINWNLNVNSTIVYKLQLRLGPSNFGTNTSKSRASLKPWVWKMLNHSIISESSLELCNRFDYISEPTQRLLFYCLYSFMLLRYKIGGYQEQSYHIQRKTNWRRFQIEALEKMKVPTINELVKLT